MEKEKKEKKKKSRAWVWSVKILILSFLLSLGFSIISELALSSANLVIAIIVILVFIGINILLDMVGLAVASSSVEPFTAMASRKVKGSKQALALTKNADKVSSICSDVIGDICGILAGAAGASIVTKIALTSTGFMPILISSLVSAIIAGITIFGKASLKRYAINHANDITLRLAKILNFFTRKDK